MTDKEHWEDLSKRYDEFHSKVYEVARDRFNDKEARAEIASICKSLYSEAMTLARDSSDYNMTTEYITKFTQVMRDTTALLKDGIPLLN